MDRIDFGLCGVVGGMMGIEMLAGKMRLVRAGIAAVGCSSMGAGSIGGKNYCGNLLWQSSVTLLPPAKVLTEERNKTRLDHVVR